MATSSGSPVRYLLPRALLGVALAGALVVSGCATNAARGPFPGFAEFQDRPVGRVQFEGDLQLPVDSLRAITSVRAPQCRIRFLPGWLCFTGKRRYRLDLTDLQTDLVRLHLYYRDHGFYGTRVVPAVEPAEGESVDVRFGIDPGQQVILRQLAVEGTEEVLPDVPVVERLPLQVDGPFRRVNFLASGDTIRSLLYRRGHAYAEVLRNYSVDTITDAAEAHFVAIPGPLVRVDTIRILGADQLDRNTILKQIGVRQGQILQRPALTESQRNLYQLGIVNFASVELAPDSLQVDPDSTSATVVVRIVEAAKYLTDAALGYGTVDCLRAGVRGVDRNFLGGGRTLEITARAAKIGVGAPLDFGFQGNLCRGLRQDLFSDQVTYRLAADFLQPRLLGTRTQLTAGIHAEREAELLLYLRESIGAQSAVSREVGRGITVGSGLQIMRGSTRASPAIFCVLFTACTEQEQRPLTLARWTNAATLSGSLDRTRLAGQSLRGYQLRTNAVWASPLLLSDDRYMSVLGEAAGFWPLKTGWDLAARLQAGGFLTGSIGSRNSNIPPERRFYAGGPNTVRGFPANALGPQSYLVTEEEYNRKQGIVEELAVQRFPLGGTQVVVGSLELRTPSPFLGQFLRLASFVDVGQVWAAGLDSRTTQVPLAGGNLVVTPGVGLRITTPVGPIRLDVGYNGYGERAGPLYLALQDEDEQLSDLILLRPRYAPRASSFLDRLQIHIAVGQAF